MGRTTTAFVEDDTTLQGGMKNLAMSYFDTTSETNLHGSKKGHFSFQTVKGEDWQDAVSDILAKGKATLGEFGEKGREYMKSALKGAIGVAEGEASLPLAALGFVTDMIIDHAEEAFGLTDEEAVQEKFPEGTWIYVERHSKPAPLSTRAELASESSMFGDSDEVMTRDLTPPTYSTGFYVNHVTNTNDSVVYCYDVEEPQVVHYKKIREASLQDKKSFDANTSMTLIRELFFLRENRDNLQYAKFQVGDEVIYGGRPYSCTTATAETITLKDTRGNLIDVDPQACTKGSADKWVPIQPGMFATAQFTLSIGELVYRPISTGDATAGAKSKGILTCIQELNGETACCVDAWTGEYVKLDPMTLVKPPIPVRRLLDSHDSFHTFKRHVMTGTAASVARTAEVKALCYGEGQTLAFPSATHVRTTGPEAPTLHERTVARYEKHKAAAVSTVFKETVVSQPEEVLDVKGDQVGTGMWVILGAGAFILLFF
jgi:hypothetical protein